MRYVISEWMFCSVVITKRILILLYLFVTVSSVPNLRMNAIETECLQSLSLYLTVNKVRQIYKPSSLQSARCAQLASCNRKLSDVLSFQGLFHGQPFSQVSGLQQMEDVEDVDWQTRDRVTNKLHPAFWRSISAQRSLSDTAALRVGRATKRASVHHQHDRAQSEICISKARRVCKNFLFYFSICRFRFHCEGCFTCWPPRRWSRGLGLPDCIGLQQKSLGSHCFPTCATRCRHGSTSPAAKLRDFALAPDGKLDFGKQLGICVSRAA